MMTVEFKIWVVTGTSRGLGRSIVEYLVSKNHTVVGCSRGPSDFAHPQYFHFELDVLNENDVRSWFRKIRAQFKKIDVLVGNVGMVKSSLFLTLTPFELYRSILETNLTSTFLVCREASKMMVQQRVGRIINISSAMTAWHEPGTAVYSASKSAVVEMTKVLAKELAPAGVTCNLISPALLKTETSDAMGAEWRERILAKQIVTREIYVEEIGHTLEFLAAPQAASISGQVIHLGLVD